MSRFLKGAVLAFAATTFWIGAVFAEPRHGIAIIGEPSLPADFANLPYANPDAPKGGNIGYGVVGTFDNLNPFILKSMRTTARGVIERGLRNLVFESLMQRSADEPFTLYRLAGETIDTDEDRTWAEFQSNPNAKWSDGQPVTPEDVIFTYETFTAKGRPPYSKRMDKIAKIEKTGERGVKFTFNEKSDREFPLILGLWPILPKHATSAENFDEPSLKPVVGSGPYSVDKVRPGPLITFKHNPDYWGKGPAVKKRPRQFRQDQHRLFQRRDRTVRSLQEGPVRRPYRRRSGQVGKELRFSGGDRRQGGQGSLRRRHAVQHVLLRLQHPPPGVRRTRSAPALAILYDFEWTNKNLFEGAYSRTGSFWQNSELSALGIPASEGEKALLQPYADKLLPEVMDGTWKPVETDGSGRDRETIA